MIGILFYLLFGNICFLITYRSNTWDFKSLSDLVQCYFICLFLWWVGMLIYLGENIYKQDIPGKIFNFLMKKIW